MKKETVIAIVFGIFLGGIVAFFIIFQSKNLELNKNKAIAPKDTTSQQVPAPSIETYQSLEVTSPDDSIITDKDSITISGKIQKGSLLVIESPIKDIAQVADSENFSVDFPLTLGENSITIVAYPKSNTLRPQQKDLKIYYLDSQL